MKGDLRMESAAAAKDPRKRVVLGCGQRPVPGARGRGFMTFDSQRKNGELGIPVMRMTGEYAGINLVWEGTSEILRIWMAREALAPYIEKGLAFLQGSSSDKYAALSYYAGMAIRSRLPYSTPSNSAGMFGEDYATWVGFINASTRSLTRSTVSATLRHRRGLHNKQILLSGFDR